MDNANLTDALLRTFNGFLVSNRLGIELSKSNLQKCIRNGFVVTASANKYPENITEIIDKCIKLFGLNGKQANSSFHKSWEKVRSASIEQLVLEQLLHYFTTYGFEALGCYNESSVYIPVEKLSIPKIDIDKITLTRIQGYSKAQIKEKVWKLLHSGVALSQATVNDVVEILSLFKVDANQIEEIKNKEVRTVLYDKLDIIPASNLEFLRLLVYKCTEKTLLIKDRLTLKTIKEHKTFSLKSYFIRYAEQYGLGELAKIFYRFKPLWTAFKKHDCAPFINQIRRLAPANHTPLGEDYINSITAKLARGEKISASKLESELSRVNIFRKIKLLYSLQHRLAAPTSILYRIRNGKGYAEEFTTQNHAKHIPVYDMVWQNIADDLSKKIKGKSIYIPENFVYALPSSEKQFIDRIPSGSFIEVGPNTIVGVHWYNLERTRIDLDLALLSVATKIGWDRSRRTQDRNILFSGDMTSAPKPNGASELFYIKSIPEALLLTLNHYNKYEEGSEVPFTFLIAQQEIEKLDRKLLPPYYMVNPNSILLKLNSSITNKQKMLGYLTPIPNGVRVYLVGTDVGNDITSSYKPHIAHTNNYLYNFYTNPLSLNYLLYMAGAKHVSQDKCKINLSPNEIGKDTILNLLS